MSYTIKVRVFQTANPNAYFKCVEKAVYCHGTWSEQESPTLTIGGSGTSGMLRFMTEEGKEAFFVTMGVHNYAPWIDIVAGLADEATCVRVLPEYYNCNASEPERCRSREAQRATHNIHNSNGRHIGANFRVAEGHNLELDIMIGC